MICGLSINAQTMTIHKKNGEVFSYRVSGIDRITFDAAYTLEYSVGKTTAKVFWPSEAEVSYFKVVSESGEVIRDITTDEVTAGQAVITDLIPETQYQVSLYNNEEEVGTIEFTTYADYTIEYTVGEQQVRITWPEGAEVSYFKIVSEAGEVIRDVDTWEISSGAAIISDLAYETQYEVYIYENDEELDVIDFTMYADNIFSTPEVTGQSVTLNWIAGAIATRVEYVDADDNFGGGFNLSEAEITNGSATITGLTFETEYTVTIYNGDVVRGETTFTTLPDGVVVAVEDDLEAVIAAVEDGETILLNGGVFTTQGVITINKNLTIKGRYSDDRPILNVQFVVSDGVSAGFTIQGIDFVGEYTDEEGAQQLDHGLQIKPSDAATIGDIVVEDCTFTGQKKSLVSALSSSFYANSLTINNCVVTDLFSNGGDFIDIRRSYIPTLTISNNTFDNCAYAEGVKARDFIRYDGYSKGNTYDDGTNAVDITFANNTLYKCSIFDDSYAGRIFYTRWENNLAITCSKNIFAEMPVVDFKYPGVVTFSNNYYSNSAVLLSDDPSGTTLDPVFSDAENGDFTVNDANDVLKTNGIGDPRWR